MGMHTSTTRGGRFGSDGALRGTIGSTSGNLNGSNHILIQISNARPLMHVVIRNGSFSLVGSVTASLTGLVGTRLNAGWAREAAAVETTSG